MNRPGFERARIWHCIRHNKTAKLPYRFIAVDTETDAVEHAPGVVEHKLRFGCAIYWDVPKGDRTKPHRETLWFDQASQFWDWVDAHAVARAKTVITAHNLAYDFMILHGIDELQRLGWETEFPITSGAKFISTSRKTDHTLWLLDSMNFCPTSLKELGRSLGLEKMDMPPSSASKSDWDKYCWRDVEIVELFWRRLIEFLRANDYGSFGQTAASLSYKIFRHKFLEHKIVIHPLSREIELERKALKGGRNECYRIGKLPERDYYVLDVNSLYPSVMATENFPVQLLFHRQSMNVEALRHYAQHLFVVARVGIDTAEPVYPLTYKRNLVFPVGRFETTLCGAELDHALRNGNVVYCAEMSAYHQAPMFRRFATTLYSQRLAYKLEDNAAFSLMCKLLLNSIYGKFGQRGHKRQELPNKNHIRFGYEQMWSSVWNSQVNVTYWEGKGIAEHEEGESFDSFPAVAAAVTSAARQVLWDYMNIAGRENVFYCDTDSLIVNRAGYKNLRAYIDPDKLGALKLETKTRSVELWGKKDYTVGETTKIKGIRRTARRIDFRLFEQERFSTMLETIRSGKSYGVTVKTERKELKREYQAGLVLGNGTVEPIRLMSF